MCLQWEALLKNNNKLRSIFNTPASLYSYTSAVGYIMCIFILLGDIITDISRDLTATWQVFTSGHVHGRSYVLQLISERRSYWYVWYVMLAVLVNLSHRLNVITMFISSDNDKHINIKILTVYICCSTWFKIIPPQQKPQTWQLCCPPYLIPTHYLVGFLTRMFNVLLFCLLRKLQRIAAHVHSHEWMASLWFYIVSIFAHTQCITHAEKTQKWIFGLNYEQYCLWLMCSALK